MVAFGKPLGTFTRKTYRHKLYFLERGIHVDLYIIRFVKILRFSTAAKIELKNTFIFTLNLDQESLNAPY